MADIALQLLFWKVQFKKFASDIRKMTALPEEELYCPSTTTLPTNLQLENDISNCGSPCALNPDNRCLTIVAAAPPPSDVSKELLTNVQYSKMILTV